ncbi:hypothetical protein RF11_01126 [Thelohanellus kitauei]|uniref:Dedicator of cytokinesis TPR repeats region domain-containing protein n=1 Tax=Thelohanellus kitauei TaxID=669202 RepID=A0A0C2MRE9_THEKT|nr:hypothetical protein RF11_01126 [Thelohanellus kitauei]
MNSSIAPSTQTKVYRDPTLEFRDIMWPIIVMNLEKFIHTEFKNVHLCIIVAHVLTGSLKYSELEENGGIRHLLIELVTYFMEISESSDCLTLYSDEVDSLSVLLSLLGLMNKSIFVEYFRPYNNTKKAEHLTRWYHVFRNILFSKNYRNSHAVEWMAIGRVLLSANKDLCPVLIETFESIHNDPCRITLLHKFLDFVLDFINFNRTLGYNLINIYLVEYLYSVPDMRAEMANVLLSIWDKLDQDDLASLYDYTRTLVVSSLIDIPDVRSCMFKILHNFMVYDYKSHGCMDKVTRTIISYIDSDTYTHDRYQVFASDFKKW